MGNLLAQISQWERRIKAISRELPGLRAVGHPLQWGLSTYSVLQSIV